MNKIKVFFTQLYFKHKLKKGELIKVDERHNVIDKTTMLVDYAVKHDLPIVVGNQSTASVIKNMNQNIKIIRLAEKFTFEIKGKENEYSNGVLVDESVNSKLIRLITVNNLKIRGGFEQNYKGE